MSVARAVWSPMDQNDEYDPQKYGNKQKHVFPHDSCTQPLMDRNAAPCGQRASYTCHMGYACKHAHVPGTQRQFSNNSAMLSNVGALRKVELFHWKTTFRCAGATRSSNSNPPEICGNPVNPVRWLPVVVQLNSILAVFVVLFTHFLLQQALISCYVAWTCDRDCASLAGRPNGRCISL